MSGYSAKMSEMHLEKAKRVAESLFSTDKPKEKKRKSRWGDESQKVIIPGLPTILPANMSEEQNQLYLS
ncbi:Splicing factor 1-like [Oopsacas minuta]|uniref:Splicing factor 1-like n=1 Tax=Oopsacas minuta TaxID=111878 RepID=A0AAV7KFN3_9METZ|nr:Splicing factor 1-like [Oopsacas minuta]